MAIKTSKKSRYPLIDKPGFYHPTKVVFGRESFKRLSVELSRYPECKNILLVCGKSSLRKNGYFDKMIKLLDGRKIMLLEAVAPNPEITFIDRSVKFAEKNKIQLVVAVGGGSVIDAAKAISLLAGKGYPLRQVMDKKMNITSGKLPCIALPTTSGTGSEVTQTASVWNKKERTKHTLICDIMFPDLAIVDPDLTASLGSYQTAVTGLDALCHALESYWSKRATEASRVLSVTSAKLIFKNLKKAFSGHRNLLAREEMSLASLYAGLAISNTGTTVCHSISYILTVGFEVPHGIACAVTLPFFIKFNSRHQPECITGLAKNLGFQNVDDFAEGVTGLLRELGFSQRLRDYGVRDADLGLIQQKSYSTSNIVNNCVRITKKELRDILKKML